jgi:hypothetical protein
VLVVSSGFLAPLESIVEIKTSPIRKRLGAGKHLAQAPTLMGVVGEYEGKGQFTRVPQRDVLQDRTLDRWEQGNKEKPQKLVGLLELIIGRLVSASSMKQALVIMEGSSELKFFRLSAQYILELPLDIRTRWAAAAESWQGFLSFNLHGVV